MHKRALMIVLLLAAVLAVPAFAQDAPWSVYLYNSFGKELLRLNSDGTMQPLDLGLGPDDFISSFEMTFSPDGGRVAFCLTGFDAASNQGQTTLVVRDLLTAADILRQGFGPAIGCRTGREAFNDDATLLAVATTNPFPAEPGQPGWQIRVIDAQTGALVQELNDLSPALADLEMLTGGPVLPYVQYFGDGEIIFAEVPYGVGGGATWSAYRWSLNGGTVEPALGWGSVGLAYLPTSDEKAAVEVDSARPAAVVVGPFPAFNVVQIIDAAGEVRTIFHSAEATPLGTQFIGGGQELAVLLMDPYNPDQLDQPTMQRWIALDRQGNVRDLVEPAIYSTLAEIPGGIVVMEQSMQSDVGSQQFRLLVTQNGETREVWESPEGDQQFWELAWATPVEPVAGLPPFPTLAP